MQLKQSILRPLVNYICEKSYYLSKLRFQRELKQKIDKDQKPPILLYQMGKVGSTSIDRSLRALSLDRSVFHTHLLTWERIKETESARKKYFLTDRYSYLQRPWQNEFLRKQIEKGTTGEKWKIITLVRDPLARNLSTFFENSEVKYNKDIDRYLVSSEYYGYKNIILDIKKLDELIDIYYKKFKHNGPLTFFDTEFKEVLNYDVYKDEFKPSKGYGIYHKKNFDILIIKLENLSDVASTAIKEFLQIDDFKLVNSNIGSQKEYAEIYKKMKDSIRFPQEYIDKFYKSKFMRHFYEDSEIENFRARWSR